MRLSLLLMLIGAHAGCFSQSGGTGHVVSAVCMETLTEEIGLDPSKLYVVTALAEKRLVDAGSKEERSLFHVTIDSVDNVRRSPPLMYYCLALPEGMAEGKRHELFASVQIDAGGRRTPSDFASDIPIPPFEKNWRAELSYSVDVYIKLLGIVDRDPFKGGSPPKGENWILPDSYIEKLVRQELEADQKENREGKN